MEDFFDVIFLKKKSNKPAQSKPTPAKKLKR